MALSTEDIRRKVEALRVANADRDQRQRDVHDVRSGDVDTVMPGAMPEAWPRPIVANAVDTSARDIAEVMGAMPSINCSSSLMTSERAKRIAGKRTKIAAHYISKSMLPAGRQVQFCDYYTSYGMGVYVVEPDFERKMPVIRVENPMGVYPEIDAFGTIRSYTKVWREEAIHLVAKFPHLLRALKESGGGAGSTGSDSWAHREIEVIKYCDKDQYYMYLPQLSGKAVEHFENPMGKVMISAAIRPGYDREIRGAFDDAIWVQLAKSRMALLGLEATEKSVRAPLFVPRDSTKMVFGADAIVRTESPEKARYLVPDVPQFAFTQNQVLDMEMRQSTRSPEARTGNVDASIITGKGVQALMGGFNTVITTGQSVTARALERAVEMMFEMDEKLWPDEKKTIRGVVQGTPFEETYVPSKDIDGNYTVDVTYGFAAGQDPARAIVALLQLRSDSLVSRDFVQRQLPMELDVVQMQIQVDNEQFEDALKAGTQMLMQSVGTLALQGQDPTELLTKMAKVIALRERGMPVHESVLKAFAPEPQKAPPAAPQGPPGLPGQGAPEGAPMGPPGSPEAAPPGADMMTLLSSLGAGGAQMSASTKRRMPVA